MFYPTQVYFFQFHSFPLNFNEASIKYKILLFCCLRLWTSLSHLDTSNRCLVPTGGLWLVTSPQLALSLVSSDSSLHYRNTGGHYPFVVQRLFLVVPDCSRIWAKYMLRILLAWSKMPKMSTKVLTLAPQMNVRLDATNVPLCTAPAPGPQSESGSGSVTVSARSRKWVILSNGLHTEDLHNLAESWKNVDCHWLRRDWSGESPWAVTGDRDSIMSVSSSFYIFRQKYGRIWSAGGSFPLTLKKK